MTGHGFRGLASTVLHEQGYLHDHIELQLAHAPRNTVSAAYNHALYLGPREEMMQGWADFLDKAQRGRFYRCEDRRREKRLYNRAEYLPERKRMMQYWADYLETQQRGKVLPMPVSA